MSAVDTIGLVACGKSKLDHAAPARALYTSALFRKSLAYAEARCAVVYVVSAEHWLLELDRVVAPYERTLYDLKPSARIFWAHHVVDAIRARHPAPGRAVILAGEVYATPLRGLLRQQGWATEQPLAAMPIGRRLQFLSQEAA